MSLPLSSYEVVFEQQLSSALASLFFAFYSRENRIHMFLCNKDPRIVRLCVFSIESVMHRRSVWK